MSRIGNKPIELPKGVTIEIAADAITIAGPKGKLISPNFPGINVTQENGVLNVKRENDLKTTRAFHGLVRSLVANHIVGSTVGFSKLLILNGVGYRAQKKGKQLVMSLGFSHDVVYDEPADVTIEVPEPTKIKVSGIDRQRVGQVAAEIRAFKQPEPYKAKGIRYEDETVRRKAGKTGKK
ncbi:MAG: 50S ribosomal protein L6 [Leptospiraceae bacterium]|nr:50S ribosomal protein L6 [Leptospiraceae bacterium]MCB1202050.1 50S ribosomal protein L6 [Leptospiraceae bacterium]